MENMKKSAPGAERRSARSSKKPYVKPEMSQVSLRPEEAVLGGCKVAGSSRRRPTNLQRAGPLQRAYVLG